jgi:hypothetical protein
LRDGDFRDPGSLEGRPPLSPRLGGLSVEGRRGGAHGALVCSDESVIGNLSIGGRIFQVRCFYVLFGLYAWGQRGGRSCRIGSTVHRRDTGPGFSAVAKRRWWNGRGGGINVLVQRSVGRITRARGLRGARKRRFIQKMQERYHSLPNGLFEDAYGQEVYGGATNYNEGSRLRKTKKLKRYQDIRLPASSGNTRRY